jgi:lipoprotein-releasing system permease protein
MLNKNLFYAIQLEKAVILIILLLIIVVASFNVVSTLMMLIHDKTKEISILKSMGFTSSNAFKMILLMGVMIGVSGIGVGFVLSLMVNFVLFKTNLIKLPSDIYYIDRLPVAMDFVEIVAILAISLIIVLLGAMLPALKIAKMGPMEGIKNDIQS